MEKIKILHVISDGFSEYNSSRFRTSNLFDRNPFFETKFLHASSWMNANTSYLEDWADIISVQRIAVEMSVKKMHHWSSMGKKVVIDFDDAYQLIREDNAAYNFWSKGEVVVKKDGVAQKQLLQKHPVEQMKTALSICGHFTTPSSLLVEDWSSFAEGHHLRNYICKSHYMSVERPEKRLTVGWGGSLSHIPSFVESGILSALEQIFKERRDLTFVLIGDERVKKHLPIRDNQVKFLPYFPWNEWYYGLSMMDVGLAPLAGEYDQRRSWIKILEYLTMNIPFVATAGWPYKELFNETGGVFVDQGDINECLEANPDGWYDGIMSMINFNEDVSVVNDVYAESNYKNIFNIYKEILEW